MPKKKVNRTFHYEIVTPPEWNGGHNGPYLKLVYDDDKN